MAVDAGSVGRLVMNDGRVPARPPESVETGPEVPPGEGRERCPTRLDKSSEQGLNLSGS